MSEYPVKVEEIELGGEPLKLARVDQTAADYFEIAQMCGDFDGIEAARKAIDRYGNEAKLLGDAVCYIIGVADRDVCKVGVSLNPFERLKSLQGGSGDRLYISHLFWMPPFMTRRLERYVLDIMEYRGRRKIGEWLDATAKDAGELAGGILEHSTNASFSNSAMFCQNVRNVWNMTAKFDQHAAKGHMRFQPERAIIDRLSN